MMTCDEQGLSEPMILEKNGGVEVTLAIQTNENIGGAISGIILTNRQKELLEIVKNNPKISRNEISKQFGIAESVIQKHLSILKEKGILERIDGTRGYWKITHNS
jgi:ATP-dependent DNA helicase RecG